MLQTKEVMICTCMFALRMEVSDNVHLGLQIHLFLQSFWMIVDSSLGYCTVNGLISPGRAPLTSGWKSHLWIKGNLQPANSIWICFRSLSISLSVIIFALFSCTSWLHWSKRCRRPSCYVCFPDRMGQVTAMHFEGVCLIKFPVSRPHAFLHFPQGLVNKSYNIQPNFHFLKIPLSCPRHHLT